MRPTTIELLQPLLEDEPEQIRAFAARLCAEGVISRLAAETYYIQHCVQRARVAGVKVEVVMRNLSDELCCSYSKVKQLAYAKVYIL